jgi:hypothetical protein
MKIRPLGDRILVKRIKEEDKTKGSGEKLGARHHHGPRFPAPPCNPGRSVFPRPVRLKRPHTPQPRSVYLAARP